MKPSGLEHLKGKRIAITGVCGTVGRELLRQLAEEPGVSHILGIDNNESELFFCGEDYRADDRVNVVLGDIRDRARMHTLLTDIDVVFHSAALKHVPLCESSPSEAIQSNITGTQNVLDGAREAGVERVIFTSTDKAVNPTNVMGTSKLMAERLVTAAAAEQQATIATSTRFGNVLGSRGSVVPLFARQIRAGGPVTLTSAEMTRFVMSLEHAAHLVLQSAAIGEGGEVFITRMPIARIEDLAHVLVQRLAPRFGRDPESIEIIEIGSRPGEKVYEELMNDEETRRSYDIGDFFVVQPALLDRPANGKLVDRPYNSSVEAPMTPAELDAYLEQTGVLKGLDEEV